MLQTRPRAALARLLGATVAMAAVAGFGAERGHAAISAQISAQTLRITGDAAGDSIALRLAPGAPGTLQVDLGDDGSAERSFDRSRFTRIVVDAGGGDDRVRIDEANGLFTNQEATTLNGQGGADELTGGSADESLSGGDGDDLVNGRRGDDTDLSGGAGNDRFPWLPGEGSDTIEGGDGEDTMAFTGSNAAEEFDASASAGRFRLFRNVGTIHMQARGLERVELETLGGTDRVSVGNLTSSAVRFFETDLAATVGSAVGDAAEDRVIVSGTGAGDEIRVNAVGTAVQVVGTPAELRILNPEAASDSLRVEGDGGRDTIAGGNGLAPLIELAIDGGPGNDTLGGGDGNDLLLGSEGADTADGNRGADEAGLGDGNDTFVWDPGDGSDVVEGDDGVDTMLFNGSAGDEIFEASANGPRLRFTRNLGNIVMDLDGVERLETNALGGADTATVNDLTGTDVDRADFELQGAPGLGDGQADSIVVLGTQAADVVRVVGGGNGVRVQGLRPEVRLFHSEPALDTLTVKLLGAVDSFDASGLNAGTVELTVDADQGDESLIGSDGDDTFVWDPGDGSDRIDAGQGADTLQFNGSAGNELMELSANGPRLRFTRNLGNIVMDVAGVETVNTAALGGADRVTVNDLAATDVKLADFDLGGPDAAEDVVTVRGTGGSDNVLVGAEGTTVRVSGLAADTRLRGQDAGDRLVVSAEAGDDTVAASGNLAALIALTIDGGEGNDNLGGGNGRDVLLAGAGNDAVDGQQGDDIALMGAGDDAFTWDPGDGSDVIEGQDGRDRMLFNGSAASELFAVSANGGRVLFTRNVGNIVMDLDDVETIDTNALGGADNATVNDLSGTDVVETTFDLAGTIGGTAGDGQPDSVTAVGTTGDDVALVTGSGAEAAVLGLAAAIRIEHSEAANDRLTVNALAGDDVVEASGLNAGVLQLTGNGGDGDDVLVGSAGADVLLGEAGDDVLVGGPGLDVLDGGPGDNVVIQD